MIKKLWNRLFPKETVYNKDVPGFEYDRDFKFVEVTDHLTALQKLVKENCQIYSQWGWVKLFDVYYRGELLGRFKFYGCHDLYTEDNKVVTKELLLERKTNTTTITSQESSGATENKNN